MYQEALRPAWAEINLSNLEYNIKQIQSKAGNKEIIGVVKADGYGHGAAAVSKVLLENGVGTLAIATLQEAISLRESGFTCPIIMLGITPEQYADTLLQYDITPVVCSVENAAAISAAAASAKKTIEIYAAVDTGMGRIGVLPNDEGAEEILKISLLSNLRIKGLFSHFATADERDKAYAQSQLSLYENFYQKLSEAGISIPARTIANSAAIMEIPDAHYDAVRPGIILYGCYPSSEVDRTLFSIKPVMSVKANIVHLKKVPAGFSVSYGRKFTTSRESIIATLTLGYADGYPRFLSGKGRVIVNGVFAPLAGNICMDQCMIDVTDVPGVKLGDEVVLMGSQGELTILADELGEKTGTINYEVVCAFGQRLPKVYVREALV
ncbi:alanine racemase [Anoxybacterium hadale]|uniref:Alanine racemase n=1 Tax=Anoxybacterium hadale TaxID=3408580 RepID=A0ACD1AEI5_9FIRM|nr:alanine racemase [Clostridiales bacterium]